MSRSKSSKKWLREHFQDKYVKLAQKEGYRSRAAFKLLELNERDNILQKGMTVVDLGASPGGWSEVAKAMVGDKGQVFALDILEMAPISGVDFICGDFTEEAVYQALLNQLGDSQVDVVLSDMAPNMSGQKAVDIPRALYLCELAFDFAKRVLPKEGTMLIKVFHGAGFDELLKAIRGAFTKVMIRKPDSSRSRSREVYVLAKSYKL